MSGNETSHIRRISLVLQKSNKTEKGVGEVSPVLRCWLGLLGCMEPWQTGGCTAPSGGITPVRAKNWLMDEHRSAICVGSRDQLFSSACLILSLSPWKNKKKTPKNKKKQNKKKALVMSSLCMEILLWQWNVWQTVQKLIYKHKEKKFGCTKYSLFQQPLVDDI